MTNLIFKAGMLLLTVAAARKYSRTVSKFNLLKKTLLTLKPSLTKTKKS